MAIRTISRRSEWLTLLLAVGYLAILTLQVRKGSQSILGTVALTAFGPLLSAYDSASRISREGFQAYFWQRDAVLRAEQLAAENRQLQGRLEISRGFEKEILELRQLVNAPKPQGVQVIGARALVQYGEPFGRYLVVSCDTAETIPIGAGVMGPTGAVGRVQARVGGLYRVLLVTDPNSATGVISERTGVHGVAVGEGQLLRVRWVTNEADVKGGDVFVTSGDDGIFPPGVRMGTVTSVADGGDYLKKIILAPLSDMDQLTWVLILKK